MCGLNCLIDFPNWKLQNHPLKMQMKIFLDQILFCQLGRYQVSIHDAPCSSIFEECCLGLSEPLWLKLPSCQTVELKIDKNSFQSIINIHQLVHLIWFSGAAFQSISTKINRYVYQSLHKITYFQSIGRGSIRNINQWWRGSESRSGVRWRPLSGSFYTRTSQTTYYWYQV